MNQEKVRELIRAAELVLSRPARIRELDLNRKGSSRRTWIASETGLKALTEAECDNLEIVRRYIEERAKTPRVTEQEVTSGSRHRTERTDLPDLWKLACDHLTMAELANCTPKPGQATPVTPINPLPETITATPTQTKEAIMTIIKVETRTFINDTQADKFTDAQLFGIIQQQEAKIAELDKIENKPAALAKEIQDRKDGIAALVKFMDSRA